MKMLNEAQKYNKAHIKQLYISHLFKVNNRDIFYIMDLYTFTKKIHNEKLHFLCTVNVLTTLSGFAV